MVIAEIYNNP